MPDDDRVIRSISCRDLFPWLIIFRSFRVSVSLPVLFLATIGVLLTPLGWIASNGLFVSVEENVPDQAFRFVVEDNNRWPGANRLTKTNNQLLQPAQTPNLIRSTTNPATIFQRLSRPFRNLFDIQLTITKFAYFLFGGMWTLLVWALFGGAISRIAVMRLGRDENVGLKEAFTFAGRKMGHYFVAPLGPLLLIAVIALPVVLLGLLLRISPQWGGNFALLLAGLFWILVLLDAFLIAVLLLGLLFGWPLMWGAISAEGTDAFDALSRSYAYTFQRPLHYLFYAAVAVIFGALGWMLVATLAETTVDLGYLVASWGAGRDNIESLMRLSEQGSNESTVASVGAALVFYCVALVRIIAVAFGYSFFWCSASAIYLLLRSNVDQTELDEIFIEKQQQMSLPPLTSDSAGVPDLGGEPTTGEKNSGENPAPPEQSD